MSGAFPLEILTPKSVLCDLYVNEAIIPAYDGDVGILPDHADFIGELGTGIVSTRLDNDNMYFVVSGGFYRITDAKLTIMASYAEKAEKVDAENAKAEILKLEEELEGINSNVEDSSSILENIKLNKARVEAVSLVNS